MGAAEYPFRKAVVVRLFRLWAMTRERGSSGFADMHRVASELGLPDETAIACASLFQLVEAELGRPLAREYCCARTFTTDELALLGVIETAPWVTSIEGTPNIPHGLPGAIRWAVLAIRRALNWPDVRPDESLPPDGQCPFHLVGAGADLAA